jgi:hypothetical protein
MTVRFIKMHANGDDFIVVDIRGKIDPITSEVARRLGDRNRGVGFYRAADIGHRNIGGHNGRPPFEKAVVRPDVWKSRNG